MKYRNICTNNRVEGVKDGARVSICVPPKNAIGNGNDNDNENGIRDLETVEHDKVVLDQDDEANDYQDCYNVQQNEVGQDQDCDNVQNYEVGQDLNQENVQRCEVGQDQTQEHMQKDDMGRNEDQENMQKDVEKSDMDQDQYYDEFDFYTGWKTELAFTLNI
ncbi:hypothetical protein Tco_1156598 [Tanacetum coccineum]